MHGGRKVRAAPCGQRMSAFVHLSVLAATPSSSNGVPQRAWRAAQTRWCRRAIHVQLAPVCSHSKMGATSSEGASSAPVQRNKSRITAEAALLALCSSGAH